MKDFLDCFEWQAQINPSNPAIMDSSQIVSYSALAAWTDAVATQLSAQGLDPTKPIAYLGPQGINLIVAFLASQKAGYPFLPINRTLPPKLIGKLLTMSNSSICINDQEKIFEDGLASVQTLALEPLPSNQTPTFQRASADKSAIALLHCSSGSSCDPKIIPHSCMALQGYINLHRNEYRLSQTDVVAHMNNFWLESVLATFSVGATLSCFDPSYEGLRPIIARMLSEKISVLPLYPALFRTLLAEDVKLPDLRLVMVSGEAITKSDVKIFDSITSARSILLNCYASQEAIWVASYRHQNGELMHTQFLPLGKPVDQIKIQILSKDGTFLPAGEIGEIVISSHLLPSGYLDGYAGGEQQFYRDKSGFPVYKSQDLGYLDNSGNLHFVARQDDQIKIRGHLVDTKTVEKLLIEFLAFEEVAISYLIGPNDRKQLICYYVSNEVMSHSSFAKVLQTQLPGFMIPSFFQRLDKLPKTPSGKISRRQLENIPLAPEYSAGVSTENTIEKVVSKLMADVLERSGFSKHDDFFDIGGDSLAAFNLISKLEVKFGINFPLENLYLKGASVKEIASCLEQKENNLDLVTVVPLNYSKNDAIFYALPTLPNRLNSYLTLADALSPTAQFFGLRFSQTAFSSFTISTVLEEIAKATATRLIESLDGREINLVGFSAGGVLACQTAKAINDLGHNINSLILIDSPSAGYKKYRLYFLPFFIRTHLRRFLRWVQRKEDTRHSFLEFRLRVELGNWSPATIQANRVIFFQAHEGYVDENQIGEWQRAANGRLEVIPIHGGHNSLMERDVALHIAQVLSAK